MGRLNGSRRPSFKAPALENSSSVFGSRFQIVDLSVWLMWPEWMMCFELFWSFPWCPFLPTPQEIFFRCLLKATNMVVLSLLDGVLLPCVERMALCSDMLGGWRGWSWPRAAKSVRNLCNYLSHGKTGSPNRRNFLFFTTSVILQAESLCLRSRSLCSPSGNFGDPVSQATHSISSRTGEETTISPRMTYRLPWKWSF